MLKVIVEVDTFLKQRILSAQDLSSTEKCFVPKGQVLNVLEYAPDRNQHLYLKLAVTITAADGKTQLDQVYAYDPHVRIEGEAANQLIKLNVPYFSQLNNDTQYFGSGWRQCNTTSNAMLADYLLKGELTRRAKQENLKEAESVYMRLVNKYGDTIDHNAQTRALSELGIESYFSHSLSSKDVLTSLRAGVPVVVGFAYKGSGHICVIVGHDPVKKVWLVHDPYGSRHGSSDVYDVGIGGKNDAYSYDTMQRIFWDMGGERGWGRVVTKVKGTATGLPTNL